MEDNLTKEEFQEFKDEDFIPLRKRVTKVERSQAFTDGKLIILIPLIIAILGIVITILVRIV